MTSYDVRTGSADAELGVTEAVAALRRGDLVVLPTDTVYGIAADAFSPASVRRLLEAKGRTAAMPVPVLVGSWRTLDGLVDKVPPVARELVETHWPGPLTLVLRAASTLAWDLGDTRGTVAVR
ncbi:MAG TPA: Sua5/YciO/YrdC/YwlC family protein, partial [Mycobacteriales bacterium]|nr:Sua5/YciO/YrdC/YwlC family protein [Mycobacteriales bacterium]